MLNIYTKLFLRMNHSLRESMYSPPPPYTLALFVNSVSVWYWKYRGHRSVDMGAIWRFSKRLALLVHYIQGGRLTRLVYMYEYFLARDFWFMGHHMIEDKLLIYLCFHSPDRFQLLPAVVWVEYVAAEFVNAIKVNRNILAIYKVCPYQQTKLYR